MADGVVLALEAGVVGLLLLGAAQRKQGRPKEYEAHAHECFVVAGRFVQPPGQLADACLYALGFASELGAVIRLVLHGRGVARRDVAR